MLTLVLFLVALSSAANAQESTMCGESSLDFDCAMELADFYKLHWSVNETSLEMALEATTEGWVGFAFADEEGSMVPADFVIGYVDDGEATVNAYYSEVRSISEDDIANSVSLTDTSGTEEDGVTIIYFTRDTTEGTVAIDLDSEVPVNYAVGSSDSLSYHGPVTRGSAVVNFS